MSMPAPPVALPLAPGATYCMDCVSGMQALADGTVDCVIADPPFNLRNGGRLFRGGRLTQSSDMAWDHVDNAPWLAEACRVLRPTGTLFVFATWHNLFEVGGLLQRAAARILNTITLVKTNGFSVSHRILYERTVYLLWVSPSGQGWHYDYALMRRLDGRQLSNVWTYTPPSRRSHPCQKDLAILERILLMATRPGDLVLDPFMGSGTTAEACVRQGRRFLGFEQLAAYAAQANARVRGLAWAWEHALRSRGDRPEGSEGRDSLEASSGKEG